MQPAELAEIARLTGLQGHGQDDILGWIAQVVGCPEREPRSVEKATLLWIARAWKLEGGENTDELEQRIRTTIAREVADHLRPAWALTCALAAVGPEAGLTTKLKLLEKTAALVVPSESARRRLFADWTKQCARFAQSRDVLSQVLPNLEPLRTKQEARQHALSLALVVSLADGRMSLKAEKLFHQVAVELGMRPEHAGQLMQKLSGTFWIHHHDAEAKGSGQLEAGWTAAAQTLGSAGMLEALVLEAREELAEAMDPQPQQRPAAWRRALGSLPGISSFLSARLPGKDQATLVRLVYLMILRQHTLFSEEVRQRAEEAEEAARQAAAAAAEAAKAAQAPPPPPPNAAEPPPVPAAEPDTVPLAGEKPSRSIKL